jgi:hypothetical protein
LPAKKADDAEEAFDKRAARASDRRHGPGQSDYLRRLTDRLVEDDKQIRLKGGPGIQAIGVLGSDVFAHIRRMACDLAPTLLRQTGSGKPVAPAAEWMGLRAGECDA